MIKTVIKKGTYHDSVVLMLLTNQISAIKGVKEVSIMMATLRTRTFLGKAVLKQTNCSMHRQTIWQS